MHGVRIRCGLRAEWPDIGELLRVETEIRRAEIELREFLQQQLKGALAGDEKAQSYWKSLGLRIAENIQVSL